MNPEICTHRIRAYETPDGFRPSPVNLDEWCLLCGRQWDRGWVLRQLRLSIELGHQLPDAESLTDEELDLVNTWIGEGCPVTS